jgi:hypothetical protein
MRSKKSVPVTPYRERKRERERIVSKPHSCRGEIMREKVEAKLKGKGKGKETVLGTGLSLIMSRVGWRKSYKNSF